MTTTSTYHDYASEPPAESLTLLSKVKNNNETNFPVKLHYMLSDMEADGLDHIVSWQPHGRSFTVNEPGEFVDKILPLWFRQSKLSSFQRQLNLYGFKRITQGPDKGAHYHELFLRRKRFLAHRIPRMKIKGGGPRRSARPAEEPNFYAFPYLPANEKSKDATTAGSPGTTALKETPAVYQMPILQQLPVISSSPRAFTNASAASTSQVNTFLEQALAHQAYMNYTQRTAMQHQPLAQPPALGAMSIPNELQATTASLIALREKELITAALLQRLRR